MRLGPGHALLPVLSIYRLSTCPSLCPLFHSPSAKFASGERSSMASTKKGGEQEGADQALELL